MFDIYGFLLCLIFVLSCEAITWGLSLVLNNVAIVDSLWPLLFIVAAFSYTGGLDQPELRSYLVLALVTVWGVRLFLYLSWRNWGMAEDYRYQNVRRDNEPNFGLKAYTLYLGPKESLPGLFHCHSWQQSWGILNLASWTGSDSEYG